MASSRYNGRRSSSSGNPSANRGGSHSSSSSLSSTEIRMEEEESFEDFLPIMAEKLGGDRFMAELSNGFRLLADPSGSVITLDSLRQKVALLGLRNMSEEELLAMIQEGDLDGDGALNEEEFCILMIRTSPSMMADAESWLEDALIGKM